MKRQDVFEVICNERKRQNEMCHHSNDMDSNHSVGDWLIFIEKKLMMAKTEVYYLDKDNALKEVVKIAALATACLEHNLEDE